MLTLYEKIDFLCKSSNTNVSKMCRELKISRSTLSELKAGRSKTLSTETLSKIAKHFNVSSDYLLGEFYLQGVTTIEADCVLKKILNLIEEHNISWEKFCLDMELKIDEVYNWKTGGSDSFLDLLPKISKYFNVPLNYFFKTLRKNFSNEDEMMKYISSIRYPGDILSEQKEMPALTKKDERDIEKKLNETLEELELSQDSLMFNGEPLDDITKELLIQSIRNGIELSKKLAKEKYTPKKYKK